MCENEGDQEYCHPIALPFMAHLVALKFFDIDTLSLCVLLHVGLTEVEDFVVIVPEMSMCV